MDTAVATFFAAVVGVCLWTMSPERPDAASAVLEQQLTSVQAPSGETFHVVKAPNSKRAAALLARVKRRARRVVEYIDVMYKQNPNSIPGHVIGGVQRLLVRTENGRHINVHELNPTTSPNLAFNRNKGEIIFMCLRRGGDSQGADLADEDVLLYILLHELAHSMDAAYNPKKADGTTAHSQNFMVMERYIYSIAASMGELDPASQPGKQHCGAVISHPQSALLPGMI